MTILLRGSSVVALALGASLVLAGCGKSVSGSTYEGGGGAVKIEFQSDGKAVMSALATLRQACADAKNVMPPLVEAVKTYATVGEISDVMREVFATYEEPAVF